MKDTVTQVLEKSGIPVQHELHSLAEKMSSYLIESRSVNTSKKYFSGFNRWKEFCNVHKLSFLPAEPGQIALYLTNLIDKQCSSNVINSAIYSIKWAHMLHGFSDPTENAFVKNLQDTAKRLNSKPVVKKDPVNAEILINLCNLHVDSTDLLIVRDLTMILLGFSGFLRFDELSNLKCKDILIFDDYLKIFLDRSKTDQYRRGNEILISKGHTVACPVSMYRCYLSLSNLDVLSNDFIFRPIFRSSGIAKLIYKNKKLSYTTARENIVKRLHTVAPHLN